MSSAGAIALAEFLPESASLLHLDLTLNNLGLAGVMALSSGLKANHVMRCLDLNIPPGDEEMARYALGLPSSYQLFKLTMWLPGCVVTSSSLAYGIPRRPKRRPMLDRVEEARQEAYGE